YLEQSHVFQGRGVCFLYRGDAFAEVVEGQQKVLRFDAPGRLDGLFNGFAGDEASCESVVGAHAVRGSETLERGAPREREEECLGPCVHLTLRRVRKDPPYGS